MKEDTLDGLVMAALIIAACIAVAGLSSCYRGCVQAKVETCKAVLATQDKALIQEAVKPGRVCSGNF